VRVTGKLKISMIDFPVFEESAEDMYQKQHRRMKRRVAGAGMSVRAPLVVEEREASLQPFSYPQ
jgi:hypothetical protein